MVAVSYFVGELLVLILLILNRYQCRLNLLI